MVDGDMLHLLNHFGGKALMVIGVLLLLVCYLTHYESNAVLIAGAVLVVVGMIWDVWRLKHSGKC